MEVRRDDLHVLIMAGGAGTRFWPLSRGHRPKQFLKLAGDGTLLEATVERALLLVPRPNLWVLTRRDLAGAVATVLPWLDRSRIVAEPEARDTAPCLVFGAARVARVAGDPTLLVLPADHVIPDSAHFAETVRGALDAAARLGGLFTFGIPPTHPATGFGYIQRAAGTAGAGGHERCHRVASFREKPDAERARTFIASGEFLWNSGIFLWRLSHFRSELESHAPELAQGWRRLEALGARLDEPRDSATDDAFRSLPRISIDHALLEKAADIHVVEAPFSWDDLGSWRALARHRPHDPAGNILEGRVVLADVRASTILAGGGRVVAALGLDGFVVVDTADALLICPQERVEEVRRSWSAFVRSAGRTRCEHLGGCRPGREANRRRAQRCPRTHRPPHGGGGGGRAARGTGAGVGRGTRARRSRRRPPAEHGRNPGAERTPRARAGREPARGAAASRRALG